MPINNVLNYQNRINKKKIMNKIICTDIIKKLLIFILVTLNLRIWKNTAIKW